MVITLYFLGTGAAMPLSRGLPCIALRYDSNIYLFDVGEGCQYRLFRSGLGVVKVKAIFITHLHGDHYLGVFGLFQSMHLSGRSSELHLIAPSKLKNILDSYVSNKLINISYPLLFTSVRDGRIYDDNKITVYAFPVEHSVEAYGFRILLKNRANTTIVYTGDTKPSERIIEEAKGANILIHESTFTSELSHEAYAQGHSTARDAAETALRAGVDLLVLTHISARYEDPRMIFYDAYRFFKKTIVAEDYMLIRI